MQWWFCGFPIYQLVLDFIAKKKTTTNTQKVLRLKGKMKSEKVKVSVTQLCLTLCDCSPPGSSVHGLLQARVLEWVAIPFCRGSS